MKKTTCTIEQPYAVKDYHPNETTNEASLTLAAVIATGYLINKIRKRKKFEDKEINLKSSTTKQQELDVSAS